MRHLIQICNLATGSKVVSWTGALNSQLQLRDLRELRNHCVHIYAQLAPLTATPLHTAYKLTSLVTSFHSLKTARASGRNVES